MDYTKRQLREILTNYGPVDYLIFDGPADQLTDFHLVPSAESSDYARRHGAPEQYVPRVPLQGVWEGNLTMGTESEELAGKATPFQGLTKERFSGQVRR